MFTTSVIGFVNKCFNNLVPIVTVRTYHNQKLWITGNIRTELKSRSWTLILTFIRNHIRRAIKQAKLQYKTKIESYYTSSDTQRMWQGLQTHRLQREPQPWPAQRREPARWAKCLLCSLRGKQHRTMHGAQAVQDDCVMSLSVADVIKTFNP